MVSRPSNVDQLGDLGGDVRAGCDTSQEASVVDALASFGVVHADMPLTLANIWLAIQGPACSEGPARQCSPEPPGPEEPRRCCRSLWPGGPRLELGPGVPEAEGAVEDEPSGRRVGIRAEVAQALELHGLTDR